MNGIWSAPTDPVDFDEAIAWHRDRVHLTKDQWDKLNAYAKRKAFMVAGVAHLDLVHDVWKAIDAALESGTTLRDFKKTIGERLMAAWIGTHVNPPARIETIFRTNVQKAYAAGRIAQAREVADERPYWMFDAVLDSRTSDMCQECDATVRPADDPWWRTHQPPLHFNCRSSFIALTPEQAGDHGGVTQRAPNVHADDGFGHLEANDEWEPNASDYPQELWNEYRKKA